MLCFRYDTIVNVRNYYLRAKLVTLRILLLEHYLELLMRTLPTPPPCTGHRLGNLILHMAQAGP